jgi:hypothetical protein
MTDATIRRRQALSLLGAAGLGLAPGAAPPTRTAR